MKLGALRQEIVDLLLDRCLLFLDLLLGLFGRLLRIERSRAGLDSLDLFLGEDRTGLLRLGLGFCQGLGGLLLDNPGRSEVDLALLLLRSQRHGRMVVLGRLKSFLLKLREVLDDLGIVGALGEQVGFAVAAGDQTGDLLTGRRGDTVPDGRLRTGIVARVERLQDTVASQRAGPGIIGIGDQGLHLRFGQRDFDRPLDIRDQPGDLCHGLLHRVLLGDRIASLDGDAAYGSRTVADGLCPVAVVIGLGPEALFPENLVEHIAGNLGVTCDFLEDSFVLGGENRLDSLIPALPCGSDQKVAIYAEIGRRYRALVSRVDGVDVLERLEPGFEFRDEARHLLHGVGEGVQRLCVESGRGGISGVFQPEQDTVGVRRRTVGGTLRGLLLIDGALGVFLGVDEFEHADNGPLDAFALGGRADKVQGRLVILGGLQAPDILVSHELDLIEARLLVGVELSLGQFDHVHLAIARGLSQIRHVAGEVVPNPLKLGDKLLAGRDAEVAELGFPTADRTARCLVGVLHVVDHRLVAVHRVGRAIRAGGPQCQAGRDDGQQQTDARARHQRPEGERKPP